MTQVASFFNFPEAFNRRPEFNHGEREYIKRTVAPVSGLAALLASRYVSVARKNATAYVKANNELLENIARLYVKDLNLSWDDDRLCTWCALKAKHCSQFLKRASETDQIAVMLDIEGEARAFLGQYGFNLPEPDDLGFIPALRRIAEEAWWRRNARRLQGQKIEALAIQLERVRMGREVYCSDVILKRRTAQRQRNFAVLDALELVNNDGERFKASECAASSQSNPRNRHAGLMARMRGFQTVADMLGHTAEMWTLTCPGFMHPCRTIPDPRNKKKRMAVKNSRWDGSTPADMQRHLNGVWKKIRSALHRAGIRIYGFRVAELHHDASIHWHFGLHMDPAHQEKARELAEKYALQVAPNEPGADKHRFLAEDVDRAKGDVPSYLAKYVSKNILSDDAAGHVGDDLFGNEQGAAMYRVEAGCSCWRVRQFQQIGGPGWTQFCELRRAAGDEMCQLDFLDGHVIEYAMTAASSSNWAAYVLVMGGPTVKRDDQLLRPARWEEFTEETGELIHGGLTKYGELPKGRIFGLRDTRTNDYMLTRSRTWRIEHAAYRDRVVEREGPSIESEAVLAMARNRIDFEVEPDWAMVLGKVLGPRGFFDFRGAAAPPLESSQ